MISQWSYPSYMKEGKCISKSEDIFMSSCSKPVLDDNGSCSMIFIHCFVTHLESCLGAYSERPIRILLWGCLACVYTYWHILHFGNWMPNHLLVNRSAEMHEELLTTTEKCQICRKVTENFRVWCVIIYLVLVITGFNKGDIAPHLTIIVR